MARRSDDQAGLRALWGRYGRDLVMLVAVGMATWAVVLSYGAVKDLSREIAARVDQGCTISETKQKNDVDALIRTYEYLGKLSERQVADARLGKGLNGAVLAGLPRTIREAQTDDAPPYCDKPNIGLPEPDPPQPCTAKREPHCIERPKNLPPG